MNRKVSTGAAETHHVNTTDTTPGRNSNSNHPQQHAAAGASSSNKKLFQGVNWSPVKLNKATAAVAATLDLNLPLGGVGASCSEEEDVCPIPGERGPLPQASLGFPAQNHAASSRPPSASLVAPPNQEFLNMTGEPLPSVIPATLQAGEEDLLSTATTGPGGMGHGASSALPSGAVVVTSTAPPQRDGASGQSRTVVPPPASAGATTAALDRESLTLDFDLDLELADEVVAQAHHAQQQQPQAASPRGPPAANGTKGLVVVGDTLDVNGGSMGMVVVANTLPEGSKQPSPLWKTAAKGPQQGSSNSSHAKLASPMSHDLPSAPPPVVSVTANNSRASLSSRMPLPSAVQAQMKGGSGLDNYTLEIQGGSGLSDPPLPVAAPSETRDKSPEEESVSPARSTGRGKKKAPAKAATKKMAGGKRKGRTVDEGEPKDSATTSPAKKRPRREPPRRDYALGEFVEAKWGAFWSPAVVVAIEVEGALYKLRWKQGGKEEQVLVKDMRTAVQPEPPVAPAVPIGPESVIVVDDDEDDVPPPRRSMSPPSAHKEATPHRGSTAKKTAPVMVTETITSGRKSTGGRKSNPIMTSTQLVDAESSSGDDDEVPPPRSSKSTGSKAVLMAMISSADQLAAAVTLENRLLVDDSDDEDNGEEMPDSRQPAAVERRPLLEVEDEEVPPPARVDSNEVPAGLRSRQVSHSRNHFNNQPNSAEAGGFPFGEFSVASTVQVQPGISETPLPLTNNNLPLSGTGGDSATVKGGSTSFVKPLPGYAAAASGQLVATSQSLQPMKLTFGQSTATTSSNQTNVTSTTSVTATATAGSVGSSTATSSTHRSPVDGPLRGSYIVLEPKLAKAWKPTLEQLGAVVEISQNSAYEFLLRSEGSGQLPSLVVASRTSTSTIVLQALALGLQAVQPEQLQPIIVSRTPNFDQLPWSRSGPIPLQNRMLHGLTIAVPDASTRERKVVECGGAKVVNFDSLVEHSSDVVDYVLLPASANGVEIPKHIQGVTMIDTQWLGEALWRGGKVPKPKPAHASIPPTGNSFAGGGVQSPQAGKGSASLSTNQLAAPPASRVVTVDFDAETQVAPQSAFGDSLPNAVNLLPFLPKEALAPTTFHPREDTAKPLSLATTLIEGSGDVEPVRKVTEDDAASMMKYFGVENEEDDEEELDVAPGPKSVPKNQNPPTEAAPSADGQIAAQLSPSTGSLNGGGVGKTPLRSAASLRHTTQPSNDNMLMQPQRTAESIVDGPETWEVEYVNAPFGRVMAGEDYYIRRPLQPANTVDGDRQQVQMQSGWGSEVLLGRIAALIVTPPEAENDENAAASFTLADVTVKVQLYKFEYLVMNLNHSVGGASSGGEGGRGGPQRGMAVHPNVVSLSNDYVEVPFDCILDRSVFVIDQGDLPHVFIRKT